tara:strand:+ start:1618 stop:2784 length:1167 start_codon:yes stop_codon:yes gene_type:complete
MPDDQTARVVLQKITLTNFRCYDHVSLKVDSRSVVLTGPNGAGKTNLLEAISLLAPGRGLRRARIDDMDRRHKLDSSSPSEWGIAALIETPMGPIKIGTGHNKTAGSRRIVRIDGTDTGSQNALAEYVDAVWLTPQMDRLFVEGAAGRRRFFDRLAFGFDTAHAGRVNAYNHAMRERMGLLRSNTGDDIWLDKLEQSMAERGVAIAAARRELAARLDKASLYTSGCFPVAGVTAVGLIEGWLNNVPALEAEQRFAVELKKNRRRDGESGITELGPHRSDFIVVHVAKGLPAVQCSTGEQKALLIAIVLANTRLHARERNRIPLLLLDEVAAHLDAKRRKALFDEICNLGTQAWLTGTDLAFFESFGNNAQYVSISDAKFRELASISTV